MHWNPVPFILAVVFGLIAYLWGGTNAAIIAVIVWLSFVVLVTLLVRWLER